LATPPTSGLPTESQAKNNFNIMIPTEDIIFDDLTDISKYFGVDTRVPNERLPLTHILFNNNICCALYYHDVSNRNTTHIKVIKTFLLDLFNKKIKDRPFLNDDNKYTNLINKINSDSYWEKNRYFKIGHINFIGNRNFDISDKNSIMNIEISFIIGGLLESGGGHLLLCLFLLILNESIKQQIMINLKASNLDLMEKFYKKIGFNCANNMNCTSNIKDLIVKCNEKNRVLNNIKIILSNKNQYFDNLNNFMEKNIEMMKRN
jgi:hypothetical protein